MRPARLRVGTVSLAHVAEAERAALTPPGHGLSPMFADGGAQWSGITATEWSGAAAKLGVRPQTNNTLSITDTHPPIITAIVA